MIYNAVNSEEASAETMFSLSESESVKQKLKAFGSDKNENKLIQWGISIGFNCELGKKKSIFLIWKEYVPLSNLVSLPAKKKKRSLSGSLKFIISNKFKNPESELT